MGARPTGSSHGRTERAVGTAEKASLWSRAPPLHVRVRTMPILCRELYSSMQPSCICKNSQRVCRMQIVCDGPHSVPQSGQRFSRVRPFAAQEWATNGPSFPVVPVCPYPSQQLARLRTDTACRLESVLPRNRSPGVVPRNGSEDAGRESWTAPHRRQRRGQCPLTDADHCEGVLTRQVKSSQEGEGCVGSEKKGSAPSTRQNTR